MSPDKKAGTIVLPVFIAAGEDAASTIEASKFKPIWDVLNALKAHDDVLACELDQIRTELGRKPGAGVSADDLRKITLDLPATVDANFSGALRTYLVEWVTESWNSWLGQLQAYKGRFGHCNPVQGGDEYRALSTWVSAQRIRKNKGALSATQVLRLDELGFVWNMQDSVWNERFKKLLEFKEQYGHCNVATGETDYRDLAAWVSTQRIRKKKGELTKERVERLEAIGLVWDFQQQKSDETWMKWYRELEKYTLENGNPHVNRRDSNTKLASWVWIQRIRRVRDYGAAKQLASEQVELLDKLGFRWDARDSMWMVQLEKLKEFKRKFGHCNVELEKDSHARLLSWLTIQRSDKRNRVLQPDREAMLNELGVVWDGGAVWDAKWRDMYERLKQYHVVHGNSDVPDRYEGSRQLASWVSHQRAQRKKNTLSNEQIRLLDELGFIWKKRDRGSWEDRLAEVIAFKEKHGHCDIPLSIADPPKLGGFVNTTRVQRNKGILSAERIAKLDAVGFVWQGKTTKIADDGMNDVWKNRFDDLLTYKQAFGNCNVPYEWTENPQLGYWVSMQRKLKKRGTLHPERIRLLDEAGFVWQLKKHN